MSRTVEQIFTSYSWRYVVVPLILLFAVAGLFGALGEGDVESEEFIRVDAESALSDAVDRVVGVSATNESLEAVDAEEKVSGSDEVVIVESARNLDRQVTVNSTGSKVGSEEVLALRSNVGAYANGGGQASHQLANYAGQSSGATGAGAGAGGSVGGGAASAKSGGSDIDIQLPSQSEDLSPSDEPQEGEEVDSPLSTEDPVDQSVFPIADLPEIDPAFPDRSRQQSCFEQHGMDSSVCEGVNELPSIASTPGGSSSGPKAGAVPDLGPDLLDPAPESPSPELEQQLEPVIALGPQVNQISLPAGESEQVTPKNREAEVVAIVEPPVFWLLAPAIALLIIRAGRSHMARA